MTRDVDRLFFAKKFPGILTDVVVVRSNCGSSKTGINIPLIPIGIIEDTFKEIFYILSLKDHLFHFFLNL